jgi:hypothetical protein
MSCSVTWDVWWTASVERRPSVGVVIWRAARLHFGNVSIESCRWPSSTASRRRWSLSIGHRAFKQIVDVAEKLPRFKSAMAVSQLRSGFMEGPVKAAKASVKLDANPYPQPRPRIRLSDCESDNRILHFRLSDCFPAVVGRKRSFINSARPLSSGQVSLTDERPGAQNADGAGRTRRTSQTRHMLWQVSARNSHYFLYRWRVSQRVGGSCVGDLLHGQTRIEPHASIREGIGARPVRSSADALTISRDRGQRLPADIRLVEAGERTAPGRPGSIGRSGSPGSVCSPPRRDRDGARR